MADRLIPCCILLLMAAPALAQSAPPRSALADPTRPPPGTAADPAVSAMETGPVLQSVLLPKAGKPVAIIGGQAVVLGGRYGDSRLVALSEREAVLKGPAGIERLPLTPGIEKTNRIVETAASQRGQSKGKP